MATIDTVDTQSVNNDEYVDYAEHCLKLAKESTDRESRVILREMVAEWLRLSEVGVEDS
ncbi:MULTISPECIES: hypothetical protein [Rhodopseudomonas]|uniref:hypothetical protein n=1 Tax=Rhodopseudomonas TaxID=1073 RepID=UPI000A4EFE7B|nr:MULTISPECIES: hypothetical protein [Rhodopseudomonas]MDF3810719.1 hypothetical protein [Rhodopseudomonas sp. BAL398]WOK20525.1 hypothetical protein RBJ75_13830 [Rhodopseudomonas sp. BAL398]